MTRWRLKLVVTTCYAASAFAQNAQKWTKMCANQHRCCYSSTGNWESLDAMRGNELMTIRSNSNTDSVSHGRESQLRKCKNRRLVKAVQVWTFTLYLGFWGYEGGLALEACRKHY